MRAPKPELQARIMLLKKLGLEQDVASIDIASSEEFLQTFREPLSPAKQQAIERAVQWGLNVAASAAVPSDWLFGSSALWSFPLLGPWGPQCRSFSCRTQQLVIWLFGSSALWSFPLLYSLEFCWMFFLRKYNKHAFKSCHVSIWSVVSTF